MPSTAVKEPKMRDPINAGTAGVFLLLLKRVQSDMRLEYAVEEPAAVVIA